jgi:multiple sugar transport system substrate-binding protein
MDASGAQRAFWAWLRAAGKEFYNGGRLGFESADLQRWFEMWADARKRGALASADLVHLADSESIDKQLVVTKQAAVSFIWSNQMPEAQKLTDHELGITSYPGDPKGQWARVSMEWAIASGSQHPDQVADVINFLVNDPEAGRILGTERGLPANLRIREQIAPTLTPAMKLSMEFEQTMLPRFGPTPAAPPRGQSTLSKLLMAAAESVIYGQRTPQQAAEEFTAQAEQALAG